MIKPLLGLRPKQIWLGERMKEILEAITRCKVANVEIPNYWHEELKEVMKNYDKAVIEFEEK